MVILFAIGVFLIARSSDEETTPDSFSRTSDPQTIAVAVIVGQGDSVLGSIVDETPQTVAVTVRIRRSMATSIGLGVRQAVTVHLQSALDGRKVVDKNGRPLPETN